MSEQADASACVVIDEDQFWDVNDTIGHTIGDEACRMVSLSLASGLRREAAPPKGN